MLSFNSELLLSLGREWLEDLDQVCFRVFDELGYLFVRDNQFAIWAS